MTTPRRDARPTDTGRPMVILVGADWCPACQTMKNDVVPQVKRRGLLGRVAYAVVNLDRQRDLGRQLVADGPIPQFIMYRKTREGWKRRRLIGGQNVETVEAFIKEGLELDKTDKLARKDAGESASSAGGDQRRIAITESPTVANRRVLAATVQNLGTRRRRRQQRDGDQERAADGVVRLASVWR